LKQAGDPELERKRSKGADSQEQNNMAWLTTFNDLVTLLMVFFVLVFTMSSIDAVKIKDFKTSLQSGLGVLEAGKKLGVGLNNTLNPNQSSQPVNPSADANSARLQTEEAVRVEDTLTALESEFGIKASFTQKGVLIRLDDSILFDFGRAEINVSGYPVLDKIAAVIQDIRNPVRIEGHTDNVPIATKQFPSNWELSTARAVQVLKYFITAGEIEPRRLSAVGYGEAKPVSPNDTPDNRAKNRRVEIVLVTEDGE
jgi:chemotaxis protein MotB